MIKFGYKATKAAVNIKVNTCWFWSMIGIRFGEFFFVHFCTLGKLVDPMKIDRLNSSFLWSVIYEIVKFGVDLL